MTPISTVSVMILSVAGPFLATMIIVYSASKSTQKAGGAENEDVTLPLVSIIYKPYPDQHFYTLSGTGIIVGDNIILTVPEVMPHKEMSLQKRKATDRYFVSTGTKHWLNRYSIKKIEHLTLFTDFSKLNHFTVMVLLMPGSFSADVTTLKGGLTAINPEYGSTYMVQGWPKTVDSTKAVFENTEGIFPFSEENCINITGGVIFEGPKIVGFVRLTCGENKTKFNDYFSPVTNFVTKILKSYPNVKLKSESTENFEPTPSTTTTTTTTTTELPFTIKRATREDDD